MKTLRTGRRSTNISLALGFVLVLILPILDMLFDLDPVPLIDKPVKLEVGAVKLWFETNYGFKDILLQTYGKLQYELFGASPNARVLPGRRPWLFLRDSQALDAYRNIYPFSDEELQGWIDTLAEREEMCAAMNFPYLFIVAPSKPTIYGENLPEGWEPVRPISRLDQLYEELDEQVPQLEKLDLRPILQLQAKNSRVYYHTDTHWNELGAFAAVQAVHRRLRQLFPRLGPAEPSIGTFARVDSHGGDLARLMGLKYVLREEELHPILPPRKVFVEGGGPLKLEMLDGATFDRMVTICPEAPLASAVIFHDSFGKVMIPYLSRLFRRAVFVWSNHFDGDLVSQERPQVVVQEIVERRLLIWRDE